MYRYILYMNLYLAGNLIVCDDNFLVVSPLESIQDFNLIRQLLDHTRTMPEEEETSVKDEICRSIVESKYIRDIFQVHPITPHSPKTFGSDYSNQIPENITGPYKQCEIVVNGQIFYDFVFSCLSWNYDTKKVVDLYISRQFTLNHLKDTPFVPFRLVSKNSNYSGVRHIAEAIVEKPIEVHWESRYKKPNANGEELLKWSSNICILPSAVRVRLCTIILGATQFRAEMLSLSSNNNEPQCKIEYVWYADIFHIPHSIKVWTLECKAATKSQRFGISMPTAVYIFQDFKKPHSFRIAQSIDASILIVGHTSI